MNTWQTLLAAIPDTNNQRSFVTQAVYAVQKVASEAEGMLGIRRLRARAMQNVYTHGFHGAFIDTDEMPSWARAIARYAKALFRDEVGKDRWTVAQVMPTLAQGNGTGKRCLNFRYLMKLFPEALMGSQDYGNCVAWSTREGTMVLIAIAIALGLLKRYKPRHGTALVYGSRGSSSQGMDLATACRVVSKIGQSEEKDYGGGIDLSTEDKDESRGNAWGRSGVPSELVDACKGDVVVQAYNLESPTLDMIKDVFAAGGVIKHGSNRTAAASRNGLISSLTSIGGHDQCAIGMDDTDEMREWVKKELGIDLKGDCLVIHDQSWGDWLDLPKWPTHLWGPRPEGAWVTTGADALSILRSWGDGWAMVGSQGFTTDDLPDFGSWVYLGE